MSSRTRTLRRRLLLWVSAPLIALWIISTLIDHDVAKGFVNLNYDRALLDTALDLGRNVRESGNQLYLDLPQPVIEMLISGEQGRFYYRADGPGGEYVSGDPDLPDPPAESLEDRVTYYNAFYRDEPIRAVALRVPVRPGSGKGAILIQVAERTTLRDDFARQIMIRMMIPQGIIVLLSTLTIWFGIGLGLRALTAMRREIENRSHVDLSPIDESAAPAEVQPLVRAMNDLLERLSAALAAQQRFIADAAHQLRTPVAALKTQAEVAMRQARDGELSATLQQLHTAADHAARLVQQLLTMARRAGIAPQRDAPTGRNPGAGQGNHGGMGAARARPQHRSRVRRSLIRIDRQRRPLPDPRTARQPRRQRDPVHAGGRARHGARAHRKRPHGAGSRGRRPGHSTGGTGQGVRTLLPDPGRITGGLRAGTGDRPRNRPGPRRDRGRKRGRR
ncbi:MAG: sensor histidine kinase N-terminal domain-containing protein [Burkholderiales bacterium]|nr:sensor histidine kinase N-terminal domain-containing protein [Burkholderiales bacterium]